ncbi:helix-turn-helix transcriptional regulator [Sphingopyxis sp. MSC1_008]|jgi:DNA-binding CsgD family transcriptional regulator|uniref:helix-turn-helix transcriptional regulator n=1 Tax=Sphingopyxis sp. MSC1_008 TaxID=2909265 RepID=UPI0020BE3ADF|nr:helix-turn-helix transcriptional regulator [Sphingopyxis sp. MSC1_008]
MDSLFAREAGEVENAFLAAPFEEDGWNAALRLFARRTGSSRAQLLGLGDDATLFNFMPDIDAAYQREFLEIEGWRPEVNWRVAASGRPLEILSEAHYDVARQHSGTDDYEEHIRRWDGVHGCQTVLVEGEGLLVGLAALRSERDGRTGRRDRKLFAAGATYALAAVRMQQAMAQRGAAMTVNAFDAIDVAAFLIDRRGAVAALSGAAEAIVGDRAGGGADGALRLRRGRLGAARRDADAALQAALGRALNGEAMQQLWIGSPQEGGREGGGGLLCEIFRLPRREWDFGFDPRVLVVARRAADIPAMRIVPLRAALGLTEAEAEIALRLANGEAREDIAAGRGTSAQTLGTQIKSILRKSDVAREAELTALVNRLLR